MYSPSSVFSSEDEWTPTRCLLPMCGEIHISTLLPDGEPVQCLYRQTFSRQQRKRPHSMTAPALKAAEIERDVKRQRVIAQYRAQLIGGPVLLLTFRNMHVQFDPRNLQPAHGGEDAGREVVEPSLRQPAVHIHTTGYP
ncbi:hypothetical protein [Tunturiibacter gelidoferens]|jgi:hypothetical protein|uniref:Uncharacterized protein n=1 Tax=Tunturiibacter gelidiferens TaxID=3069689 RepID=A0A9X0U6H9_9BACT|nr:hypothetical protein [Edaphobacter lichenicola]MBB5331644.1 hypothetical protein [Edaphobacter lichenicola]